MKVRFLLGLLTRGQRNKGNNGRQEYGNTTTLQTHGPFPYGVVV